MKLLRGRSKGQTGQKEPDWIPNCRCRTFLGPSQETVSGGQGFAEDCVRVVDRASQETVSGGQALARGL